MLRIVNTVLENSETLCVPESFLHYYLPHSQQNMKAVLGSLETDEKIVRWDTFGRNPLVSDASRTAKTKEKLLNALVDFHEAQPLLPGQNATQLRSEVGLDETGFEKLENQLIAERQLVKDGNLLHLASHEIQFTQEEETAKETLEQLFLQAGIHTPALNELRARLPEYTQKVLESTFYALLRLGRFVKIDDNFFIHSVALTEVQELLIDLSPRK